jgi:phosphoribosylformylglycinamidine synthase II
MIDTVSAAAAGPVAEQPWAELGLKQEEYDRINVVLGRRPTECELAMYSVMWSEHCSYKSSKVHLRRFGDLPHSERLLAGIGENAGVVDVGQGIAVTFKVESHNHPSYVEPYQGAATGIGGIVRDILAMGARPIAVMDPLRFGDPTSPDPAVRADVRRVVRGVVAGIGGYGNCLGLPNIGGEVVFDASYNGNPLVNALCVGVLPVARLQSAKKARVGDVVVLYGAKTGRDGIGGVSVLASASFDADGPAKRPTVQVGDPFQEKIVTECSLELFDAGLVRGIQDLGGAGFTCAISEISAGAAAGMRVQLDAVPLREASMDPVEVLSSESQERMCAIVDPADVDAVLATCARWGVLATVVGEITEGTRLVVLWHGEVVVDVPPGSLADDGPVYDRPIARSAEHVALQADSSQRLPRPTDLRATLLQLVSSPELCSRRWITQQFDRYVQGNTVLAMPEDAGVLRLSEETGLGVAVSVDGPARFCALDPYLGAQHALAEACRNVAAVGAVPYAVTDCLNFGSPEDPGVMWQFAETVRGIADACRQTGLPVTGGNVSFYNSTADQAIHPTPVVGVLGLMQDVRRRTSIGFSCDGDALVLLGETADELDGSAWAWVTHRHLGGHPPALDLQRESALQQVLVAAADEGLLTAAHDLSEGGLAQALVESALHGGIGARVELVGDAFVGLWSESAGRALVALPGERLARLTQLCGEAGLPLTRIGTTTGTALIVQGAFEVGLAELHEAFEGTLPALFA